MIQRWDIVTIGNLSRNCYWGESDDKAVRKATCTCTLIVGTGSRLLVDPSCGDAAQMATELGRRTGLTPDAVDAVFVTHEHRDHHAGLACFAGADWLAAPAVAEAVNASGSYEKAVQAVGGQIRDCIDVVPTPGHTLSHHGLRFDCEGKSIVVAGDAVMTRDFWRDRRGFHNSADFDLAADTMNRLAEIADVIIPGHDNYFIVGAGS